MSISTFNAGTITSNKTIPETSSVVNEFNNLSTKYVSRKSADNALMLEGGSFTNYLANGFGPTGGGVRVCNSKNSDGTINTNSFYTAYQLSCIRHHTNASTYDTYMFRDSDPNGIVRKSTGANMLSSSLSSVFFSDMSSSIADAVQTTSPTAKAVKDYIDAQQYLPVKDFIIPDPEQPDIPDISPLQTLTEALQSMLSPSNAIYYVDNASDADPDADGSLDHPFKTIKQAVAKANLRRFVGDSKCYIRLISDYTVESDATTKIPNGISLYHPDLVQTKCMYIQGWNKSTNAVTNRTIYFYAKDVTEYYKSLIATYCNVTLEYITFEDSHVATLSDIGKEYYVVNNNNGCQLIVNNCSFIGAYSAIVGNSFNLRGLTFNKCFHCIVAVNSGTTRSYITGDITAVDCYNFIRASYSATVQLSWNGNPTHVELSTTSMPFALETGGVIGLAPYIAINGMAKNANEYSGSDHWSFWTCRWDQNENKYVHFGLSGTGTGGAITASDFSNYLTKLANLSSNGYSNNGYFSINGTYNYLSSFTNFDPNN